MRVFMTGASGFVGSAVLRQLLANGHQVTGLARSDRSAAAIEAAGGQVLRGELADLDTLARGAEAADGVIHCGFIHDFANFAAAGAVDKTAIETMGAVLAGSGRPLIVTSGTAGLSLGRPSTEDDVPDHKTMESLPRVSEQVGLSFAVQGVRAMVVRLPPTVHGDGDHGFVPALINIARQKGKAAYVESGDNLWPAVHREDAAQVYVLALEKGSSGRYHAIGEEGIPFREIAGVIGRKLGLPVVSVPRDEAEQYLDWQARFAQFDVPSSSPRTRAELGWVPTGRGLLDDLENGTYFSP